MKGILQVSLSSVPPRSSWSHILKGGGGCHLSWRRSTLGSAPWIHDECTTAQARVTNSHAFLSGSCHNQGNDYSISPFYFSALLGNTAQTKVLFQFKIVHCLLNQGEVWIIKRVILDKSALPKSVVFAWVLDLILNGHKKDEKKKRILWEREEPRKSSQISSLSR